MRRGCRDVPYTRARPCLHTQDTRHGSAGVTTPGSIMVNRGTRNASFTQARPCVWRVLIDPVLQFGLLPTHFFIEDPSMRSHSVSVVSWSLMVSE
ncbi:hypothetical protein NDU88_001788 [Pleurodeles waltl]|uniref:Uncharacterized protein n=1 Tax=Pleurodeles waltl TaxID=8319 RepID=A0AAV7WJF1_PLEWA|nr:hypothetical protein NDU88_001788 [Pleurodeles waltl]